MTTVLIIVCILACIGVVLAIVGHLGVGIAFDKMWRERIARHHSRRRRRRRVTA
jgi:adenosyl cobinamide kinase/adenosyl cobinamide phosphate guanylyltransferase